MFSSPLWDPKSHHLEKAMSFTLREAELNIGADPIFGVPILSRVPPDGVFHRGKSLDKTLDLPRRSFPVSFPMKTNPLMEPCPGNLWISCGYLAECLDRLSFAERVSQTRFCPGRWLSTPSPHGRKNDGDYWALWRLQGKNWLAPHDFLHGAIWRHGWIQI